MCLRGSGPSLLQRKLGVLPLHHHMMKVTQYKEQKRHSQQTLWSNLTDIHQQFRAEMYDWMF